MVLGEKVNRLGIFFFYDKDGIVDDYVTYLLDDFVKSCERLMVVCNGKLSPEGRHLFRKYTTDIIVRDNTGRDVWAYKTAIDFLGWEQIEKYDEMVLMNYTIMGPIYPFDDMFATMANRNVDFWGIIKQGESESDFYGYSPFGYTPEYIHPCFLACRNSIIRSIEFQQYWNDMCQIESYGDAMKQYGITFTKKFADKGFLWETYIDAGNYAEMTADPFGLYPMELIRDKKCPIFLKEFFGREYDYAVTNTVGQPIMRLYDYLVETMLYETRLIWQTILRSYNQSIIAKNLQLNYILSSTCGPKEQCQNKINSKVALVMHLYFPDLVEQSLQWAAAMPEAADVYITTNTLEKKSIIEDTFQRLKCRKLEVRLIENRGRDISSLLVGVKDIVDQYDYICFVHDKKTAQLKPPSIGDGFAYKCFTNTLYNKTFVSNVINLFDNNPTLGLLSPPIPNHGDFFPVVGHEWSTNFDNCVALAERLGINVPMDSSRPHLAPLGTMFWFRSKALKPLFDYGWTYTDFPEEPNCTDGTILHAIERIYPYVAQAAGYYPAILMSDIYAKIEITNLNYYVRNYNKVLIENNICNYHFKMCEELSETFSRISMLKKQLEDKERQVEELIPQTSLKYQLKDRIKKIFRH